LNQLDNSSTYAAEWFNPRNGEYQVIGTVTPKANQWVIPDRPTAEDWVLLVKRAAPQVVQ
jgi:Putative collagen-binding domain of a collagenase